MGIYNRDYIRETPGNSRFGSASGSVCKWLIIANVVVFILQMGRVEAVLRWFPLAPDAVLHGQVWRLVTYAFCHSTGNFLHILFNMLFLWWFGKTLETMYGSREFLWFYLTGAVFSGLFFVILGLWLRDLTPAVGASGAIMAIIMVYAMYYPRQQVLIWGVLPVEIRWLVVFYVIYDTWPVLQSLLGHAGSDGIAHSAHVGGLLFGYWYKKRGIRLEYFFSRLPAFRFDRVWKRRGNIRVYRPPQSTSRSKTDITERQIEENLDAILDKINKEGEASLTDREREILKEASRYYRNR